MLTILTGRISTGKTQEIIRRIGERIEQKKRSILIVPDPVTYNFEQRLCDQLHIHGFIDVEVTSFNRLASSVIDYCGGKGKVFLDDCGKAMLMRSCVARCRDSLKLFKRASYTKGFSKRCLDMISTLENCTYSPDDLRRVAETLPFGTLRCKLEDTALIFEAYNTVLQTGFTDNSYRLSAAKDLLNVYAPLKDCAVFIDGFDVFTSRLYAFIGALAKLCPVCITSSCADEGTDADAYELHHETARRLHALADKEGIGIKTEFCRGIKGNKSDCLQTICNEFYASDPHPYTKKNNSVHLAYYASPQDEITQIALTIAQKVRSGARYKHFCILCNDVDLYAPLVHGTFRRYHIPVYTNQKHDILTHPVGMYLFSLLKTVLHHFPPESFMEYLRSGLSPLDRDEADRMQALIALLGITNYDLAGGLKYKHGSEEDQAEFESLRQKTVPDILQLGADLKQAHTAKEMAQLCYGFMEKNGVYEKVNALVDQYEERKLYTLSDVTAQLWNITQRLLENIAELTNGQTMTVSEFYETLWEGFNASPASTIPATVDCVSFGDLTSARERSYRCAFVIGACEGSIPAVYTDERLVTMQESRILTEKGLEIANSVETEDARIRYNIYAAFALPTEELYVSCPLKNAGGGSNLPSPVFQTFLHLFGAFYPNGVPAKPPLTPADEFSHPCTREQLMLCLAKDRLTSPQAKAAAAYLKSNMPEAYATLQKSLLQKESCISPAMAQMLFSPQNSVSVSRLETYAACPLQHFLLYGLTPEEEKSYAADSVDIGILFHASMEDFVKEAFRDDLSPDQASCYKKAKDIFDKKIGDIHFGALLSTERQKAINDQLCYLVCESAYQLYSNFSDYRPLGEEISFGYGKNPPIKIETEFGDLLLKGKIDRADTATRDGQVFLRVIDYKSAAHPVGKEEIEGGTDLQLMMYMIALLQALPHAEPAEAYYMNLASDGKGKTFYGFSTENAKKDRIPVEEFRSLLDTASSVARQTATDILSGKIEAKPDPKGVCRYCRFVALCGKKVNSQEDGE